MNKQLLTSNGLCLAFTLFFTITAWSAVLVGPLALFSLSIYFVAFGEPKNFAKLIFILNTGAAILGALVTAVALVGGLAAVGVSAFAVLLLLFPVLTVAANASLAKQALLPV